MTLLKLIMAIVSLWMILKIKRFISGINIKTNKFTYHKKKSGHIKGMDIQDADYEDVE